MNHDAEIRHSMTRPPAQLSRRRVLALGMACLAMPVHAADPPLVFAASSLKTALDEIARIHPMIVSYAGSGLLARQIMNGAPADLYVSANHAWMDTLEQGGFLQPDTRVDLLKNTLVLIAPKGASPVSEFPAGAKIATGFTRAVPAGQYAKRAFEAQGIWDQIRPNLVETDNVRAALALVARAEVPFGVVYLTDALAEPGVDILQKFPQSETGAITYPMALTKTASPAAARLHEALRTPEISDVFTHYGFGIT